MELGGDSGTQGPPPFSLKSFGPPSGVAITAATATQHFVVLGDSTGALYIYDVFGNAVGTDTTRHDEAIVALSAHSRADVLVSASAGGKIVAIPLSGDGTVAIDKAPPILSTTSNTTPTHLCVDPNFGRARAGNRIAWAEESGAVRTYVPSWFVAQTAQLKKPGKPDVRALAWCGHLLASATDLTVHLFDMRNNNAVCVITAPNAEDLRMSVPPTQLPEPPPSPPSPLSEFDGVTTREPTTSVDFEEIDARRAEGNSFLGRGRAVFVKGEAPAPEEIAPKTTSNEQQNPYLAKWEKSVALFMEEEDDEIASTRSDRTSAATENPTLLHVTWPLASRTIRIGPHRSGMQPPREVTVGLFSLERGDLPVSLPGALGILGSEADGSDWHDGAGLFGTGGVGSKPAADLSLSPLLSMKPFGSNRIVLVGTAWHSLALHLVDSSNRVLGSMGLPHNALKHAELISIPGGDPLVLILSHPIDSQDPDLRRAGSVGSVESEEMARLADTNVTLASALTVPEQVKWLLANGRFSDALEIARQAPGGSLRRAEVSIADIGDQFLESVRSSGDFERLATVLTETISSTSPEMGVRGKEKVMETRRKRWEHWIKVFRKADRLALVAPNIPTYEPRFETKLYDDVLLELAERKPVAMLGVLKTWPADVFNLSSVTRKVESELERRKGKLVREDRDAMHESLLMLYGLSGRHDETLNLLLQNKSDRVFEYIRSHHLYEAVRSTKTITGLFSIDEDSTTELLVNAPETVLPPDAVVPILEEIDNSTWTLKYLHSEVQLDDDRAADYHNMLLRLYVKHNTGDGELMQFLRTSNHYDLDVALEAMGDAENLAHERVFVLAAMGDKNAALDILLTELGDTAAAIEFASDHGDAALWERLIRHASNNAETLAALLDSPAGGKVDPVRLIPLLTSNMRIPKLRDRLHRILVDAALERALREDATAALRYDAAHLLEELEHAIAVAPGYD